MPNETTARTPLTELWGVPPVPESKDAGSVGLTTAQWIGEFNAELIAAEVPENVRDFALRQAISKHFERSHVLLGKAAS